MSFTIPSVRHILTNSPVTIYPPPRNFSSVIRINYVRNFEQRMESHHRESPANYVLRMRNERTQHILVQSLREYRLQIPISTPEVRFIHTSETQIAPRLRTHIRSPDSTVRSLPSPAVNVVPRYTTSLSFSVSNEDNKSTKTEDVKNVSQQEQIEESKNRIDALLKRQGEIKSQRDDNETEIETLTGKYNKTKRELNERNEENENLASVNKRLTSQNCEFKTQLNQLRSNLIEIEEETQKKLEEEATHNKELFDVLNKQIKASNERKNKIRIEKDDLEEIVEVQDLRIRKIKEECNEKSDECERLLLGNKTVELENVNLTERLKRLKVNAKHKDELHRQSLELLSDALRNEQNERATLLLKMVKKTNAENKLLEEIDKLNFKISKINSAFQEKDGEYEMSLSEIKQLNSKNSELLIRLNELNCECEETTAKNEIIKLQLEEQIKEQRNKITELEKALTIVKLKRIEHQEVMEGLEYELRTTKRKLNEKEDECEGAAATVKKQTSRIRELESKLKVSKKIEEQESEGKEKLIESNKMKDRELDKLRREIQTLKK